MIFAKDYITTGFSIDDVKKIENVISPLIKQSGKIEIDFEGVRIFTTLFFNNAFTKYVLELGPAAYADKISIINSNFAVNKLRVHLENSIDR